ncbi:EAL domain-containing protein [Actinocrispum wychmicini]|uniref:EAL domain-containing protein n=1 Tax=Actinocrispum wychmicini TaxID=1213861 RepID=A0A4R2IY16_9PSEU|nr:EAL domain-containing protein [Actinocrispum wychmicini]TCO50683.1 EAL domain-containing protein [Actinocrispum wychmicini]
MLKGQPTGFGDEWLGGEPDVDRDACGVDTGQPAPHGPAGPGHQVRSDPPEDVGSVTEFGAVAGMPADDEQGDGEVKEFGDRSPFLRIDLPEHQPLTSGLVGQVSEALDTYRFPANLLQLGMEETTMLDRNGSPRPELIAITGTGTRVVLNGFGDRVRRIRLLGDLPIVGVVTAPQLTPELTDHPAHATTKPMIQTLIELASTLKLQVTIPGVDTREQREKARKFGGTHHHGVLTGRPGPESVVADRVRATPHEVRAV